jgi:hypothetical protein
MADGIRTTTAFTAARVCARGKLLMSNLRSKVMIIYSHLAVR